MANLHLNAEQEREAKILEAKIRSAVDQHRAKDRSQEAGIHDYLQQRTSNVPGYRPCARWTISMADGQPDSVEVMSR